MGIDTLCHVLRPDSGFLCVNLGLFRRPGAFLILPLPTAGLAAQIGLVALVFEFFFLPKGLLFLRGQFHIPECRRDVLAHKIEVDLHRLGGFDTALAVTLMDKDFLDKLIEHGVRHILSDKTGEAVIIEPEEGGLSIHRETIGVLTNSPDYRWQRTNLRNFVGVTNLPKAPRTVAGHEVREFGERLGGGSGLPGDYSSPSRFVRLAFMKEFAVPGKDELGGVSRMFRAFAPVDIPEGLAKADPNYDVYEQTLCTSVMCAESGVYYFAPAQNRRISAVRLPAQGTEMQYFDLGDGQDIDWRN